VAFVEKKGKIRKKEKKHGPVYRVAAQEQNIFVFL